LALPFTCKNARVAARPRCGLSAFGVLGLVCRVEIPKGQKQNRRRILKSGGGLVEDNCEVYLAIL